jgi:hypothetical protein
VLPGNRADQHVQEASHLRRGERDQGVGTPLV